MNDIALLVLGVSLLLQVGAAAMALRLSRLTGWRAAWVMLAAAIALMAVRRGLSLARLLASDDPQLHLGTESVALVISILMVVGVAALAPVIEGLRKVEQDFRRLIESAPEAMLVLDDENRILLANAEAGRLFGAFAHQLQERDVTTLFAERGRGRVAEWLGRFQQAPRRAAIALDAGVSGLHTLGHEFPVELIASPFKRGDETLAVLSVRDMTGHVQSERALQSSEGRFKSLRDDVLDNSSVGVCILDASLRIAWVNRAFESYLGQDRERVIGLDGRHFVRDRLSHVFEDEDAFRDRVLATYDDNTYTEHFECHVVEASGRWERWLDFWSQPLDSGVYRGGRIEQYADITERHNAEQRIRQFVDIARNMQVGLIVYHLEDLDDDRTLRIRIVNPFAEHLLGIEEAKLAGEYIDDAFPKLREHGIPKVFADVLRTGQSDSKDEFVYGDERVPVAGFQFRAFPLPDQCVGVLFEHAGD